MLLLQKSAVFLEAISSYPLYLFLFKEKRKRMPLLSGLGPNLSRNLFSELTS